MTLPLSSLLPVLSAVSALPLQIGGDFLWLAVVFFVVAIVAAAVGFNGVAGLSASAARLFAVIFVVLAVIAFVL